jgi:hypothetical protein
MKLTSRVAGAEAEDKMHKRENKTGEEEQEKKKIRWRCRSRWFNAAPMVSGCRTMADA